MGSPSCEASLSIFAMVGLQKQRLKRNSIISGKTQHEYRSVMPLSAFLAKKELLSILKLVNLRNLSERTVQVTTTFDPKK
jgi:hypothetical protein